LPEKPLILIANLDSLNYNFQTFNIDEKLFCFSSVFDTTVMPGYTSSDQLPMAVGKTLTASCAKPGYCEIKLVTYNILNHRPFKNQQLTKCLKKQVT
jgi:hypothetical protein